MIRRNLGKSTDKEGIMKWTRVFSLVSCGALAGMVMGGLFGFGAGSIAPTFFTHLIPWSDVEPRGVATVFGGIAGVLLGCGLAAFGIIVQILMERKK
ncbi:MAG: hypothetical protein IAG10_00915 [Planctomycetaceae bacterium]|nr:hypothetical protein [Planctomycetaceae bacterium]